MTSEENRGAEATAKRGGAARVASGIALSRLVGFLREMVLAFFLGAGPHADVFRTALRGPNLLQNLLGEQTLSASFIPVYSRLLAAGKSVEAGRFAGAVFGLLLVTVSCIGLLGVLFAEPIVGLIAPGYLMDSTAVAAGDLTVDRYPLAVQAVRLIFPMTAVLVLSAWALGVLNSHRLFFVSYVAPAVWNAAIIAALYLAANGLIESPSPWSGVVIGPEGKSQLVIAACLGALVGGVLQFAVQLPWVIRSMRGFRLSLSTRVAGVGEAMRAFVPLLAGRGAVQISGYLDYLLASFLAAGAVAALGWAQTLYLLPISLFGMSVAAAELPELARQRQVQGSANMERRVRAGFEQMSYLTIPSAVAFLVFGFLIVAALFRRGAFALADNWLVYLVLAAYSVGLVASTTSRLLNNVFYAMGETRRPARIAVERVLLSAALGVILMLRLDRFAVQEVVGVESRARLYLGAVGLALGAGIASWYELWRLAGSLRRELGGLRLPWKRAASITAAAAIAAVPGALLWYLLRARPPLLAAPLVLAVYGAGYLLVTQVAGLGSWREWLGGTSDNRG